MLLLYYLHTGVWGIQSLVRKRFQMNQAANPTFLSVLGRNPDDRQSREKQIVVSLALPRLGEHGFKYIFAETIGKEYYHYGYRLDPKANPVNVHVYGGRKLVEYLARTGEVAVCELELVVKRLTNGKEFILVNLFITNPNRRVTHKFGIVPAPKDRKQFVYTTNDMYGTGILIDTF